MSRESFETAFGFVVGLIVGLGLLAVTFWVMAHAIGVLK